MEKNGQKDSVGFLVALLKRKNLILGLFLGPAILALILSLVLPKVYTIETILEIGKIEEGFIEEPPVLKEKIENIYIELAREKLQIPYKKFPKIKVENPLGTGLIKMKTRSWKIEEVKNILNEINQKVLTDHSKKLAVKKSEIEKEILEIENQLDSLEKQTLYLREGLIGMITLRNTLLELENRLNNISPTRVLKKPTVLENQKEPKPLLNMIVAGVLGIFVGICLVFLDEEVKKVKGVLEKEKIS